MLLSFSVRRFLSQVMSLIPLTRTVMRAPSTGWRVRSRTLKVMVTRSLGWMYRAVTS